LDSEITFYNIILNTGYKLCETCTSWFRNDVRRYEGENVDSDITTIGSKIRVEYRGEERGRLKCIPLSVDVKR